ncbi:MAG TPA: hypothetical protein VFY23_09680 [Candidatus Limnocylindrales bacterium]|nr:hypothetical protein [Candidatus Limnocylindrales bacterium]
MTSPTAPATIVAVTGEDDRYDAIRSRATAMAAGGNATVILYDIDAAGVFASPVPTAWSGEGQEELVEEEATRDRLDPDALETAGRHAIAEQVRGMRTLGVNAWGWLPTKKDAADLAAYAERQRASVVLVPKDLEQPGLVDRVLGNEGTAQANEHSPVRFETVG